MTFGMEVCVNTRPGRGREGANPTRDSAGTNSDADSGVSYIRKPSVGGPMLRGIPNTGEGVEGPIAQGYIADNKTNNGSYITLPNVA